MIKVKNLILLMRPQQWIKNLLVFAAPMFSLHLFDKNILPLILKTFCAFCLTSSLVYIINDWRDKDNDCFHPDKKTRPLASGTVSSAEAFILAAFIFAGDVLIISNVNNKLAIFLLIYFVLNIGYTFIFKQIAILDIIIISLGFILRAISGGIVIHVEISNWLLVCTFFLALFFIISKRRFELVSLGNNAELHRKILADYSLPLLDQMITIVTGLTIITYSLYTLNQNTIDKFHTENLIYTIPFVVFGMFRYLHVIYKQQLGGKPEEILFTDRYIQLSILLWILSVIAIIYHK